LLYLVFLSWGLATLNTAVLVRNDTNNKPYSANHDMLPNPRILRRKSAQVVHSTDPPMYITTAVQSTDPSMQIKPHCSVHGSSNANRDTLYSSRIFLCKSRQAVQSTDLPMQIETHCSVHGSSNANQATLFSPRIFQCKSRHAVQSTYFPMQIETRCSVHGSFSANRDALFSPRIFQ